MGESRPPSNTWFLEPKQVNPQIDRSVQTFLHSTSVWLTYRQTDIQTTLHVTSVTTSMLCGLVIFKVEKLSLIQDRGQTDCFTASPHPQVLDIDLWPWPKALTFNPRRVVVMTHTHTNSSSKSVQQTKWKEMAGQTDRRYHCPPTALSSKPMRSVINVQN